MPVPMRRTSIFAGTILLILVVGGLAAYLRFRPTPLTDTQQGDPALMLAIALGALDRSPDANVRLSPEQVKRMLPYLRVLRDTDPSDAEPSRALVDQVRSLLTQEQLERIRTLREEARAQRRREQGPPPGVERPPGFFGQGRNAPDRPTLRRQILSRLIERLQTDLQSAS